MKLFLAPAWRFLSNNRHTARKGNQISSFREGKRGTPELWRLRQQGQEVSRQDGPESGLSRAAHGTKGAFQGLMPARCSEYPPRSNLETEEVSVTSHGIDRHMLILSSCSV